MDAVLLLNHGAADSQAGVSTFLQNIFRDREIIPLPLGPRVQSRFAQLIASRRSPKVARLYEYMGGGSPLVSFMQAQAEAISDELDGMPVGLGLRYYSPSIADGLADLIEQGATRIAVFPQYPQCSSATVGSVLNALDEAKQTVPGGQDIDYVVVPPFGSEEAYVAEMAERVREVALRCGQETEEAPTLVFSAHAIPMKLVDDGDVYPDEIAAQAELIARAAGFDRWEICYQSRSGPVRWIGPETVDHVQELIASGAKQLILVPISFVQDHLETLVELDVQLADIACAAGAVMHRVRPANVSKEFTSLSAQLVRRSLASGVMA